MPRAELAGLFETLRTAPQVQSIDALRAKLQLFTPFVNANPPAVGRVDAGVAVGDGISADIIVPPGAPPFPTLIYLHGGGWSIGSPASHGKLARQLCVGAGAVVVAVDYRLPVAPVPLPELGHGRLFFERRYSVPLAALFAVFGLLALCGLPMPYHPVFNVGRFELASRNRFFLCIEARDPRFDREHTRRFLEGMNPRGVYDVDH